MENKFYQIEKVNDHLYRILGITKEFAYLVIGKNSALLIDTCAGEGNIREVVDSLTSLPYSVALSHGHVDHASGAGHFTDKEIYLNKNDFKIAKLQTKKLFIKLFDNMGVKQLKVTPIKLRFKDIKTNKYNHYIDLVDGKVFDLGDLHVEAIPFKGHTQGSMTFLIREDKILFTGDACNSSTFIFLGGSSTVKEYYDELLRYIPRVEGKYNNILFSHLPKTSSNNLFIDMKKICEDILNGKENEDIFKMAGKKVKVAIKLDPKTGFAKDNKANLFYNKIR